VPARRRSTFLAVTAAATAALVLAGCSGGGTPSGAPTTTSTTTTSSTSAPTSSTPTSTSSTSTSSAGGAAQNLVASAAIKSALVAAYVAHNGLPASQVAGTAPGSVYYAYVPSTNTYWAIAGFVPTANAAYQTQVSMQDEGCCGVFSQPAGGSWTYVTGFLGEPCPGQISAELETLWRLTYPGDCGPATTTTT
jgi:hypothetical protein